MGQRQMQDAEIAALAAEQPVARLARRRLETASGRRLVAAVPGQNGMADLVRPQPAPDGPRLRGGVRPQAMIDGQGGDLAAAAPRPALQQQCKTQAVAAARDGHGDMRPRFERAEAVHQRGEFVVGQRRIRQRGNPENDHGADDPPAPSRVGPAARPRKGCAAAAPRSLFAAVALLLLDHPVLQSVGGLRVALAHLSKGGAGIVDLIHRRQRHAQLHHVVGSPCRSADSSSRPGRR